MMGKIMPKKLDKRKFLHFWGRLLPFEVKERLALKYLYGLESKRVIINPKHWKYIKPRHELFLRQEKEGMANIPVFIISFNQLTYVRQMVNSLEKMGCKKIIIIDNASTYPPLLEYYSALKHEVIRLKENWGHKVFWLAPELQQYRKNFYILTDPDLDISECPKDSVEVLFKILKRYPYVRKVGFSLRISDIPENSLFYDKVIGWEKQFARFYIKSQNIYFSDIDTTFALYPPEQINLNDNHFRAVRVGKPYEARHLPWYKTSSILTEEEKYYYDHKKQIVGHWDISKA